MSHSMTGSRHWLLDVFGEVLDLDPFRDDIYCRKLSAAAHYPGIFFFTEDSRAVPYDVDLRKAISLPAPFPPLRAVSDEAGLISLEIRDEESPRYLRSIQNGGADFQANAINAWERFYVLSERMLHALLILAQPQLLSITNAMGEAQPPLQVEWNYCASIGGLVFSLRDHTEALEDIASLPPGASTTIDIRSGDQTHTLTFTRR
ncbi:hypothetical protein AA101099_1723 [Neoasaia chiangmaiensis NBRC 101099]|uniref:Uncharacterized protein n=1 Tax=Neoasaia chiangmaiensis TaxID=320497 RepID=A0A1U9KRE1_9PROT|nr:hypothetical protein [Neoasaia chiangmaiensis]AQS88315.1 hypothetical protein A0U93_10575 [Neoasaia chiangmaiensis]GBR39566.1 hypothetical protein AA101099_1723 [Neoasaia chiangmaiensis NBRC 101099]GEN14643.1 hypothetical protein NCH01_10740 [Neoasaia chiangmaiensis]